MTQQGKSKLKHHTIKHFLSLMVLGEDFTCVVSSNIQIKGEEGMTEKCISVYKDALPMYLIYLESRSSREIV